MKVEVKCPICNTKRLTYPSWAEKLCSMECANIWRSIKPSKLKDRKFIERRGENHINWKGEEASYSAAHHWMKNNFGRPMECEDCKIIVEDTRKIQWANISGKYHRERADWKRLCTPCHRKFDGYGEKIAKAHKEGKFHYGRNK